jgi:hypothetical protein
MAYASRTSHANRLTDSILVSIRHYIVGDKYNAEVIPGAHGQTDEDLVKYVRHLTMSPTPQLHVPPADVFASQFFALIDGLSRVSSSS